LSLIVHAPNVHRGGGKTLLLSLLQAPGRGNCLALVDERLDVPKLPENIEIIRFPPTVAGRISAERLLKARTQPDDAVLCLGNLPPLFRLRARRTVLFLQNRYLLDAMDTMAFPAGVRWRIAIERKWLRCKIGNVQQTVVQTPSMADAVRRRLGLEAWVLLARAGIKPLLRLTLNPVHHAELTAWIEDSSRSFGLRIENAGEVAPQQLSRLYDEAGALIYPSFTESLGLPLLEARAHGLPIIASERDFVRDIVTPQQTFDPESALSIARAVRRFLGTAEPALQIRTPAEFLDFVQGG
jgi:hypothetical protein